MHTVNLLLTHLLYQMYFRKQSFFFLFSLMSASDDMDYVYPDRLDPTMLYALLIPLL